MLNRNEDLAARIRGCAEQIGRMTSPETRRYEKRAAAKARRRAEKRDPEHAPVKVIRGWAD